jgi:small subunit ribosomal protein S8|tara:strand:- start:217939 stop:218328 length:390 start_codon:yes stop_codon:yes gene_type:complete
MTDPIADMLARVKNSLMARQGKVSIPGSKIKAEIAALLTQEGYIKSFKLIRDEKQGTIRLYLKYHNGVPVIQGVKRISKPGLRVYVKAGNINSVLNGSGTAIISTSRGILTDSEAREANVGGEILCNIW